MEVKFFLSTLLTDGTTKGIFELAEIGQLPNACCLESTTTVIDFDKAKVQIVASSNMHTIKSCDGLKILAELERVDFIEFKGFKAFTRHQLSQYKRLEPLNLKIDRQFAKYDLQGKIEDSLVLWELLIRSNDFIWNNETRKAARGVEKRYIILTDIDPEEDVIESIALNLTLLGDFSTFNIQTVLESKLKNEVENIPTDLSHNLKRPILKHCNNIDEYYNALTN